MLARTGRPLVHWTDRVRFRIGKFRPLKPLQKRIEPLPKRINVKVFGFVICGLEITGKRSQSRERPTSEHSIALPAMNIFTRLRVNYSVLIAARLTNELPASSLINPAVMTFPAVRIRNNKRRLRIRQEPSQRPRQERRQSAFKIISTNQSLKLKAISRPCSIDWLTKNCRRNGISSVSKQSAFCSPCKALMNVARHPLRIMKVSDQRPNFIGKSASHMEVAYRDLALDGVGAHAASPWRVARAYSAGSM